MTALLALALAMAAPASANQDRTYLLSVSAVPLGARESMYEFSLETWGVEFLAVCHIPQGWRIEAGGGPTFEGVLKGQGSLGATWLDRPSLKSLRNLVLVSMFAPIQRAPVRDSGGHIIQPVTFKGRAQVSGGTRDRTIALSYMNVRLVPAKACPTVISR
jgi:hypothetical protein